MRRLVISDIHANLEALNAVLDAAEGAYDGVLCLGDTVGYGANPNECSERVANLPHLVCLVGNHDLAALGAIDIQAFNPFARTAAEWTGKQLSVAARPFLEGLVPEGHTDHVALAHASPRDPIWEYVEDASQGPPNFAMFEELVCLVGHTHIALVLTSAPGTNTYNCEVTYGKPSSVLDLSDKQKRIVNPGSVGQPRDGDTRAAYALWDTKSGNWEFCRTGYDIKATQSKIVAAGLPSLLGERLHLGR